jgi:hypothetical protein
MKDDTNWQQVPFLHDFRIIIDTVVAGKPCRIWWPQGVIRYEQMTPTVLTKHDGQIVMVVTATYKIQEALHTRLQVNQLLHKK